MLTTTASHCDTTHLISLDSYCSHLPCAIQSLKRVSFSSIASPRQTWKHQPHIFASIMSINNTFHSQFSKYPQTFRYTNALLLYLISDPYLKLHTATSLCNVAPLLRRDSTLYPTLVFPSHMLHMQTTLTVNICRSPFTIP